MPDHPESTATAQGTQTLRLQLKQRRLQQDAAARGQASSLICQHLAHWLTAVSPPARHIAAFWPLPFEPDLTPLLTHWAGVQGLMISLPVVMADALSFRLWTPETAMRTGAFNIQEPQGAPAPPPDVMLVPTLGFSRRADRLDRLGYGKGYYDRTLAQLKHHHPFISVGIAWACGEIVVPDYRPAAHDVPLDAIVTEHGMIFQQPLQ